MIIVTRVGGDTPQAMAVWSRLVANDNGPTLQ